MTERIKDQGRKAVAPERPGVYNPIFDVCETILVMRNFGILL